MIENPVHKQSEKACMCFKMKRVRTRDFTVTLISTWDRIDFRQWAIDLLLCPQNMLISIKHGEGGYVC